MVQTVERDELSPHQAQLLGGVITGLAFLMVVLFGVVAVQMTERLEQTTPRSTAKRVKAAQPSPTTNTVTEESAAAPSGLRVIRVDRVSDDPTAPLWDAAPALSVPLTPQQLTWPGLGKGTVDSLAVKAASDGKQIAFHLSWKDENADWNVDSGRFCDAVAIGFPLDEGAPATMGGPLKRMQIIYWKALWQKDIDEHYQDVQDLHPNYWSDLYWFAEGSHPYPVDQAFKHPKALQFMPAMAAKNPMSKLDRKQPVEELVAEGWGTLTHQDDSASRARGLHRDGRWEVVITRPLHTDDGLDYQFESSDGEIVFAVWDGDAKNVGGRKHWSSWTPFGLDAEARATQSHITLSRVPNLGQDDPYAGFWNDIPSTGVSVTPQQITWPRLKTRSITHVRAQAATDGSRIAFRVSWGDRTQDMNVDTGRFSDGVAIGFPLDGEDVPSMMGAPNQRMQILFWKALWQKDIDEGYQDVQHLHPNYWTDLYWFAEGKFPFPVDKAFERKEAKQYFPAHAAKNPMATFKRVHPVQELVAEGFGSLTHQKDSATTGRGAWRDGRWTVVFSRPLRTDDPLDYAFDPEARGMAVFAVWDGANHNRGARKHWADWIELKPEEKP